MLPTLIAKENIKSFLGSFDNILTDCDGVLWRGECVIPSANLALNKLRSMGKRIFFISNNSTKSRETLVSKAQNLGYIAEQDEAISTSYVMAEYLKNLQFKGKAYVIGSPGIGSEFDKAGIAHCGIGKVEVLDNPFELQDTLKFDPDVSAVCVGYDPYFNITKLAIATSYLARPSCLFIGTNRDNKFPVESTEFVFPGTGALVKAVETASEKTAEIMGKPNPRMFTIIGEKLGLDPKRTLMIGDNCTTDIILGKNCGLLTLSVLSGVHSWENILEWSRSSNPENHIHLADYYLPSLGHLDALLPDL